MNQRPLIIVFASLMAAACNGPTPSEETSSARWYTEVQVASGEPVYQSHCAGCHGIDGSATANWRATDADGNYPPPPLNGTAHTWHHPMEVLTDTIAKGGAQYGGLMPGFADVIDAGERLAVVAYIQSWWSDEVYSRWSDINAR